VLREIEPWRDARLRCGIGHTYGGRVRVVEDQGHDMDGETLWYPPRNDYDPDRCIVCGLKTWTVIDNPVKE
jgi:hypothetical protein